MAHEIKVVLNPDIPRAFRPDTFDHLLQLRVSLPGLDTRYIHTLVAAVVAADGDSAELTIHSEAIAPTDLGEGLRFLNGTPMARVRVVTADGETLLAEQQLNAPLRQGQRVAIGEEEYVITGDEWPGRDKVTGVCHGDLDWQHAYAVPIAPPASMPVSAELTGNGPAVTGSGLLHRQPPAPDNNGTSPR